MCRSVFNGGAMYVIVGLGNPERKYARTLHNMGFNVIDALAEKSGIAVERKRCKALVGEGMIGGKRAVLCKPQTYMNLSGESVVQLLNWYKCSDNELIVIYDDVDLPAGKLRFRAEGSAGTHNGMRNIVELTGKTSFPRFRVGVGRPPEYMDLADYVLSEGSKDDRPQIDEAVKKAAEAVEVYLKDGLDAVRSFVGK